MIFDRQVSREKAHSSLGPINNGAHEKRFEYYEKPSKYIGNYKAPLSISFDKMKPRDDINILKNLNLQDYEKVKIETNIPGCIFIGKLTASK